MLLSLLSLGIGVACLVDPIWAQSVTVDIPGLGSVKGDINHGMAKRFTSLPYAQPPVGDLRWKQAETVQPWSPKVIDATVDPPGCPQVCDQPAHSCPTRLSEDCLYLNVWTPAEGKGPWPVMLFIHGGNLQFGYGNPFGLYDGTKLANRTGVVVVTINYRLGALGFAGALGTSLTGSYGVLDQQEALRWVKKHIGAFGGDGEQVTVFGQSAGAVSIAYHMTSPAAKGLFVGGIVESDPFTIPMRTPTTMDTLTRALGDAVGCEKGASNATLEACLRAANFSTVLAAQEKVNTDIFTDLDKLLDIFFPWMPIVDSSTNPLPGSIPQQPLVAFAEGTLQNDVPILIGTVLQEGQSFVYSAFTGPLGETETELVEIAIFGLDNAARIAEKYQIVNKTDSRQLASQIATYALFQCATRHAVLGPTEHKRFIYHFNHLSSFSRKMWGPDNICDDHVCHADELPYVFYPNASLWNITFPQDEVTLAHTMQTFWSNFAKHQDPGSNGEFQWHPFDVTEQSVIFDTPSKPVTNYLLDTCTWWDDEIGYDYS